MLTASSQKVMTLFQTVHAREPTWSEEGKYTIKLSYGGNIEKSIKYVKTNPQKDSILYGPESSPAKKPESLTVKFNLPFTENPSTTDFGIHFT